ncbi:calcium-binding protein [Actinoplanes sp. NPDC024001]|uniref:calcium-binding protein n=1 Tax=Actinoplanes sp. NPDC024001 TaxID=3154598 RepID=UPI0033D5BB6A
MPRFTWSTCVGLTLLTTLTAGALAAPAQAATAGVASVTGTKVQYKAAKGKQNRVVVTRSGNTITVDDVVSVKPGTGCKKVNKTKVRCSTKTAPTRVRIYTYDRNDTIVNKTDLAATVDGGTGSDKITGGPRSDNLRGHTGSDQVWGLGGNDTVQGDNGNDKLYGGDGNDYFLDGYGNDVVRGENGDDHVFSSSGDDRFYGDAGNDRFDMNQPIKGSYPTDDDLVSGGSGVDSAMYVYHSAAVSIDLDGAVGDDGMKGEKDTVAADIENLVGGFGNDRLVGNAGDNSLEAGEGKDVVYGLGGNDRVDGQQHADKLYGGAGDDVVIGEDYIGGHAADLLDGGTNTANGDLCDVQSKDSPVGCESVY